MGVAGRSDPVIAKGIPLRRVKTTRYDHQLRVVLCVCACVLQPRLGEQLSIIQVTTLYHTHTIDSAIIESTINTIKQPHRLYLVSYWHNDVMERRQVLGISHRVPIPRHVDVETLCTLTAHEFKVCIRRTWVELTIVIAMERNIQDPVIKKK